MEVEGLFRREGKAIRLNQDNYVAAISSSEFTVHDVCSMVKRFFRDLKEPLLSHPLLRKSLMDLAKKSDTKEITRQEFCTVFELGFEAAKKGIDNSLSPALKGTLGYLMRQLHRISNHSTKHQMDAKNLATVFAPTLFRDGVKQKGKRKERRGTQDDLLSSLREDTKLQITAIRLLIEHANWIGLHPNCYITSTHHHRSSSATPSPRPVTVVNVTEPKKEPLLDRKNSMEIDEARSGKSSTERQFSSGLLGLFHGFGGRFTGRRSASKDEKQGNPRRPMADRRASSPAVFAPNEPVINGQNSSTFRSSAHRYMLDIADSSKKVDPSACSQVYTSNDALRSSSTRISRNRQAPGPFVGRQIKTKNEPLGRCSHHISGSSVPRADSATESSESFPLRTNKILKDNPVSMIGEEHFNPIFRERHERSRRRHTAPVKMPALKRNQPNSRHSGLVAPKRRGTIVNAGDSEKENCAYQRDVSADISSPYDGEFDGAELEDARITVIDTSADLLHQKGQESRSRRVRRQQRKETSSLLQDSRLSQESPFKYSGEMVSTASSPIIFPKAEEEARVSHGSAVVGETIVVNTGSLQVDEATVCNISDRAMPPAKAQSSHTSHSSAIMKDVSKIDCLRISTDHEEGDMKNSGGNGSNGDRAKVIFRYPTMAIPVHDSANSIQHSNDQRRVNAEKSVMSLFHKSGPKSAMPLPKTIPLPTPLAKDRGLVLEPCFTLGAGISHGDSDSTLTIDDDMFSASNDIKAAILNAKCDKDIKESFGPCFRPSVAAIERQGIVRDRVNLFRKLENPMPVLLEPISGRASGLSSGSLDTTDEAFVKPSAPPVTRSLNMGIPKRKDSSSLSSHAPLNSPQSPK
ncbi:hypothetical protein Angca_007379 [Angiostrongylus cantonensis]|nr:hypothetical protein Angca_007379 [Angiostrongylus cantonensis]